MKSSVERSFMAKFKEKQSGGREGDGSGNRTSRPPVTRRPGAAQPVLLGRGLPNHAELLDIDDIEFAEATADVRTVQVLTTAVHDQIVVRDDVSATDEMTRELVELERLRKRLDKRMKELVRTSWPAKKDALPWLLDEEGNMIGHISNKTMREVTHSKDKGFNEKNAIGKFVYHMTSYQNLVFAPGTRQPFTGVLYRGLDPGAGGGPGGASELCRDPELKASSELHSKDKICVTTNRLAMRTYINQREDFAESQGAESLSIDHYSILLRFRIKAEHTGRRGPQASWQADPDDARAFHLQNKMVTEEEGPFSIPPSAIECLTTEGWVSAIALTTTIEQLFAAGQQQVDDD
jgi:hypothetical protein